MRVESLLIIFLWLAPGLAIRGERRPVRDLRGGAEDKDKDVFDSNGDKPKEEKDKSKDIIDKEKEKASKKSKDKKCKKAMKAKKSKKSKKEEEDNLVRRYAEVVKEEETKFCLHSSEMSEEQCDKVKKGTKLPKDGTVQGGLDLEIVHPEDLTSGEILENVNEVLSYDTNSRFVGCEDLDSPPPKKGHKMRRFRTRRYLEEYETVPQEQDHVDVTGVDFENLDVVAGGKKFSESSVGGFLISHS